MEGSIYAGCKTEVTVYTGLLIFFFIKTLKLKKMKLITRINEQRIVTKGTEQSD